MTDVYEKLPLSDKRTIRVLIIEPSAERTAPIIGKLETANLDEQADFEALSYTWGPREPQCQICCNGQTLSITRNCHEALAALRYTDQQRRVWVDAICIDQSSNTEKNHQVPLMISIYESASLVIVWLGSGDEHSSIASWLILQLSLQNQSSLRDGSLEIDGDEMIPKQTDVVKQSIDIGSSMTLPYRSPYFSRIWTVQEIAVARKILVMYGDNRIPWKDFVLAWHLIKDFHEADGVELHYGPSDFQHLQAHFVPVTREGLVDWWREPEEKSERDKTTVEIVFAEHTARLFSFLNVPGTLCSLDTSEYPRSLNLASWVIDLTHQANDNVIIYQHHLLKFTSSGKEERYLCDYDVLGNNLRIEGLSVDLIEKIMPKWYELQQDEDWTSSLLRLMQLWQKIVADLDKRTRDDKIWSTTVMPKIFGALHPEYIKQIDDGSTDPLQVSVDVTTGPDFKTFAMLVDLLLVPTEVPDKIETEIEAVLRRHFNQDDFKEAMEHLNDPDFLSSCRSLLSKMQKGDASDAVFKVYVAMVFAATWSPLNLFKAVTDLRVQLRHLSLFVTSQGHIGSCSNTAVAGDEIVLFEGGPCPYVLRPLENNQWRYLGPAYVDGIMFGEAWPGNDHPSLRTFDIV